ncbi:MAG: hypothetical protein JO112_08110 [Planctomycetes bacterium]|nr:hypothetical protein [Planctomycetota bacterium]
MLFRYRRLLTAAFTLAALTAAVLARRQDEPPQHTFRITLGLTDKVPTDWSGRVDVRGGEVAELTGWRFEVGDAVEGMSGWKCRTRNYIAPEFRWPIETPSGQTRMTPLQPWPNGITLTVRGAEPAVTLTLPRGEIKFAAGEVALGEPRMFLDNQVRVERLPAVSVLRPPAPPKAENSVEDDYPAFWIDGKSGKQFLAWVAYQKEKDRVLLAERAGPNDSWSEPREVDGPGDHFRVALAGTGDGTLWVVYSAQRQHDWDLYGRPFQEGQLGEEVRLTEAAGPDLWHRMTTDSRGRAWLVWQGFHNGQSDIFARCADESGWGEPVRVSTSQANDWDPAIAADPREDRVWVGWDTYDQGSYGVRVRSLSGGPAPELGEVLAPEESPLFQAHVSLACDPAGRLWAAWDESGPQWAKDYGFLDFIHNYHPATRLYESRQVRLKCLVEGRWQEPTGDLQNQLPLALKEYNELPQLQEDGAGRLWVAFRHRTCRHPREDGWATQASWDFLATAYLGDRWLPLLDLPHSAGRNDMRASSQRDRAGNVYFAYASDNRGWTPPGMPPHNLSIAVSRLGFAPTPGEMRLVERRRPLPAVVPVHPREKEQVARIRAYKIEAGGKTYHIYRGDIHRHTDISADGMGDGSLLDLHRYALDAAALDFVFVTDHNMGQDNEYCWWRTQKANDLYTVPGAFISMYGYERSVPYPDGHRNVIWTERGHRTLPLPRQANKQEMAEDTAKLYAYLRDTHGICTPHTSATDQGTNWEEHDDSLEPFVEIFQGYHTSYEAPGAPKTVNRLTESVHGKFQPEGFVSRALEKGYRLGFQASSDHISTHTSYACILAEDFSRQGLVAAMRKRHSYAATDNIVLDVRLGKLGLMGDEVHTAEPRLDVVVLGTGPIDRVEVLRNGAVLHTESPKKDTEEVRFSWEDREPVQREKASYYYVRVLQKDGQMAWASPIWVQVEK